LAVTADRGADGDAEFGQQALQRLGALARGLGPFARRAER
jgi:hypothetical protein